MCWICIRRVLYQRQFLISGRWCGNKTFSVSSCWLIVLKAGKLNVKSKHFILQCCYCNLTVYGCYCRYWPELNDSVQHGAFTITCTEQDFTDDVIISRLMVSCDKNDDIRPLTHFHFVSWPDFGVPENRAPFLELIHVVGECRCNSINPEAPVVVHCSAGIGR